MNLPVISDFILRDDLGVVSDQKSKWTEVLEESKEPFSNQLRLQHLTNPTHVHQFSMKHDYIIVTMCDNGGPCQNMYQNVVHISKTTSAQTGSPTLNGCYGSSSGASFRLHQHLNPNNSICEETCSSHFTWRFPLIRITSTENLRHRNDRQIQPKTRLTRTNNYPRLPLPPQTCSMENVRPVDYCFLCFLLWWLY